MSELRQLQAELERLKAWRPYEAMPIHEGIRHMLEVSNLNLRIAELLLTSERLKQSG